MAIFVLMLGQAFIAKPIDIFVKHSSLPGDNGCIMSFAQSCWRELAAHWKRIFGSRLHQLSLFALRTSPALESKDKHLVYKISSCFIQISTFARIFLIISFASSVTTSFPLSSIVSWMLFNSFFVSAIASSFLSRISARNTQ